LALPQFSRPRHGDHHSLEALKQALWAAIGSVVLLFIFLAALGAIDPIEATEVTVVVVAFAVAWLAHAWRELWLDERP
jgi:hypothetical protein